MPISRLSPLDDSFLVAESPTAHMHVGWAAVFEPSADRPRPSFADLRRHIESRLSRAPRYRQKLSSAPLHLDAPSWVDDDEFDIRRHVNRSESADLDQLVERCMSRQLRRDRPLWEFCIADRLSDGRIGVVGKAHHCMVDGIAAVELASLLLDPTEEAPSERRDDWEPEPAPGTFSRLVASASEKARTQLRLARRASRFALSSRPLALPRQIAASAGVLGRALRPATPVHALNDPISSDRVLGHVDRPLADLERVKRRFRATINDVYLAIAAGAVRRLLKDRGERPRPLKTMVPVNVRDDGDGRLGNRISFMFVDLPCEEPDPERRLRQVHLATSLGKEGDDSGAADKALDLLGYAPRAIQRLASHAVASPRMFNLVVSNIPGPREPMYMLGCELKEAYPIVPLADRHALSIGMTTIRDRACFGLYADRRSLSDVDRVAEAVDQSTDELLEAVEQPTDELVPLS